MVSKIGILAFVGLMALTVTACSDDKVPQAKPGAAKASTASEESSAPAGPSEDDLQTLFKGLNDRTPDALEAALGVVAPGSLAELYVKHQSALAQAYVDGGNTLPVDTLTAKDGVYMSCGDDETGDDCAIWSDLTAEGDKVASFTTNGKDLQGRILAGGKKAFRAGDLAKVRLLTAYQSSTGDLWITLDITNTATQPIAIESRTSYRSPEGRQSAAGTGGGPTSLQPDSLGTYALVVERAKLGGTLHVELYTESGGAGNGVTDIPIK